MKFYNPEEAKYYDPVQDHKVVLITGGNSGIGWYTILHLYLHGYIIYIAGRTQSKVEKAIDDIKSEAEKRQKDHQHPFGQLNYIYLDLLDLDTIPKAVEQFKSKESHLDVLINNAGIMGVPYKVTKDNYEIQYQVNFVSHFLLTLLLLPIIKSKVINLSSIGHNFQFKHFKPQENTLNKWPNSIYTWVRYGIAKSAQIQITKEFAHQNEGITFLSVHPGIIMGTELYNYWRNIPVIKYGSKVLFSVFDKTMGVSNEQGSLATLRAVMDPDLKSGEYLITGGEVSKPSKIASNPTYCKETFDWNIDQLQSRGFNI